MGIKIKDIPFEEFYKMCLDAYKEKKRKEEMELNCYFCDRTAKIKKHYYNKRISKKF